MKEIRTTYNIFSFIQMIVFAVVASTLGYMYISVLTHDIQIKETTVKHTAVETCMEHSLMTWKNFKEGTDGTTINQELYDKCMKYKGY